MCPVNPAKTSCYLWQTTCDESNENESGNILDLPCNETESRRAKRQRRWTEVHQKLSR